MITKDFILSKLPAYTNSKKVLVDDQNTDDIIIGLLDNHEKYKDDYDKISEYFIGRNDINTAKNVYNFLKKYVPYYIEPSKLQTLRSPSAILSIKQGADCKSYASFVNGIFDSLNRKGIFKIPLAYRFASYKNSTKPGHVFAVLYPGNENEIWVDNVLDNFNEKKQPTYFKDKKLKMALVSMSGVDSKQPNLDELKNYRDKLVTIQQNLLNSGQIVPGSQNDLQMKVAINKVTKAIQNGNVYANQIGLLPALPVMASTIQKFLPIVQGFFSNQANPNDWKGWDAQDRNAGKPLGSSAGSWITKDGDSVKNEASNILAWIEAPGHSISNVLGVNGYTGANVTYSDLQAKLKRGQLQQEADTLTQRQNQAQANQYSNLFAPSNSINPKLLPGGSNILPSSNNQAGMSPFVLLALAGAGIYFFTRKK
jgi:hypothetical protein